MIDRLIRKLSVGRRIAGGLLASVALLALAIPFVIKDHMLLYNRLQELTNVDAYADRLLLRSSKRIESSRVSLMRYVEDSIPSAQDSLVDIAQARRLLNEARELMRVPEQWSAMEGIMKDLTAYESLVRDLGMVDKRAKTPELRRIEFMALKKGNEVGLQIESIVEKSEAFIAFENDVANKKARKSLNTLAVGYGGVVLLSIFFAVVLGRSITKPIAQLRIGAESFREGRTDTVLTVEGSDELSLLTRTFNDMGAELHQSQTELQERAMALEEELAERRRMEEAVRESEERFRTLFDGVPVGLYRSTPQGDIITANMAMVNVLGYPDREKLLSTNARDLYVETQDRRQWEEQIEAGVSVHDFESQVRRYDGTVIWIEDSARVVRNEEGAVLYFEGSIADITQRKNAEEQLKRYQEHLQELVDERTGELTKAVGQMNEEIAERYVAELALRESQQRMALLVHSSPLAFIEWDLDFRVVAWNPAAESIFGYTRDEVMGRHAGEIIIPEEVRSHVDQIWRAIIENKGGTRSINDNVTRDGKRIPCEWHNSALVDDAGRVFGVASLVDDISERMGIEAELNQNLKDLERFNRLVVGRETRMLQLKREINALRTRLGQSARYIIPTEADDDSGEKANSVGRTGEKTNYHWGMIGNITRGRPTLGSTMDVAVYRLMHFTVRDVMISKLGHEAADRIYFEAGELAGKELHRAMMPKGKSLMDFLKEVQDLLADLNVGILKMEKSDAENLFFILTLAEDLSCSGLPVSNEAICTYDSGLLSGLLFEQTKSRFHVKEIDCWCSGEKLCRFEVKPDTMT